MSGIHLSKGMRAPSARRYRAGDLHREPVTPLDGALIRILVLDHERDTLERLENALWIWPHKIARTSSVDEAVAMCRHLMPTALIADINFSGRHPDSTIKLLRKQLPNVPIVALGSQASDVSPGKILDQGADAFLPREELHRPMLHDLLQRIQRTPESMKAVDFPMAPQLSLPWRDSRMVGALICDISGAIVDANDVIAKWLEYSDPDVLIGKLVWRDVLSSRSDWPAWKKIAGDVAALLHQTTTVRANNGQLLWMKLEIFAAPGSPSHLQVVFIDQTEIALLSGREVAR